MTALVGLACNGCNVRVFEYQVGQVSTTRIRQKMKAEGWRKTYHDGVAFDICPSCWEGGVR